MLPKRETDHMPDTDAEDLSYADAMTELEGILAALEGDALDVDSLADRVARAARLIDHCRGRIERARTEVGRVVVELGDQDAPSAQETG